LLANSFAASLVLDDRGRPRFGIHPTNLYSAMWLQLALDAGRDALIRRCPTCRDRFEYGPGTGRRETAIYCRDRCCAAAHDARAVQAAGK
jgi:hypothetical protein